MGDDVSMVNNANGSSELSKNELVKLLQHGDSNISLIAPEKFKSPIWERFRIVFYKGEFRSIFGPRRRLRGVANDSQG